MIQKRISHLTDRHLSGLDRDTCFDVVEDAVRSGTMSKIRAGYWFQKIIAEDPDTYAFIDSTEKREKRKFPYGRRMH